MSSAIRPARGVVVLLITLLVAILIGCGGSGGDGGGSGSGVTTATTAGSATSTSGNTGQGTLLYTLQWPVSSRAIPSYALSVVISVYELGTTNIVAQATVNRGSGAAHNQTVTFNLPPGQYTVVAEAKPDLDGGGDTVASDTFTSTVVNGQTVSTTIQFDALVDALFIDDLPSQASIGQQIQLHAHAEDSDGNGIFPPSDALDWTITSGGAFADITSDGKLTLLSPGSVTIQVREIDSDITATKSVTLVEGPTNGVIIIVS